MNEQEEQEPQEQETSETEVQKRFRRKSVRRQLQEATTAFDKLLADPHQKPAKKADLLIQKSTLLTRLLDIEVEERKDSAIQENETLKKETSAFRELNITPEHVAALREEIGV